MAASKQPVNHRGFLKGAADASPRAQTAVTTLTQSGDRQRRRGQEAVLRPRVLRVPRLQRRDRCAAVRAELAAEPGDRAQLHGLPPRAGEPVARAAVHCDAQLCRRRRSATPQARDVYAYIRRFQESAAAAAWRRFRSMSEILAAAQKPSQPLTKSRVVSRRSVNGDHFRWQDDRSFLLCPGRYRRPSRPRSSRRGARPRPVRRFGRARQLPRHGAGLQRVPHALQERRARHDPDALRASSKRQGDRPTGAAGRVQHRHQRHEHGMGRALGRFVHHQPHAASRAGIGNWNEKTFINAIRLGKKIGVGRPLLPPMPWKMYANLTDDDLESVFAYLKTIPAIANRVPNPIPPAK